MIIYLHVEVSARELDGKLLLATLAAAKGHEVVLSDLEIILKGLLKGHLNPGIYHTKSLTPSKFKIERHQKLIDGGSIITSIDEESGIDREGYEEFSKTRYSKETINQSSAVFSWGEEDFEILKKNYKEYSNKIYKSGSPRIDLCKEMFFDYWNDPKSSINRPYILISSNMKVCSHNSFADRLSFMRENGYFKRSPGLFKEEFLLRSNDYLKALIFIDAIKYLSDNNNGYDIVLRPHPTETSNCWKVLLEGIPNVYVEKKGPINPWIKNSFAVIHHGCTSAIEATLSKKPLITYIPPELKDHPLQNQLSNKLGFLINTKEELLKKINHLYDETKSNHKIDKNFNLPLEISKKIYLDDELAAEKIIKIWEKISGQKNFKSINLTKFKFFIFKLRINRLAGDTLKLFSSKFNSLGTRKYNEKFPKFNIKEIKERIEKFRKILKIENKLQCILLADRTIIIRKV
jgi:surface carbohydrate biosynthesis protein